MQTSRLSDQYRAFLEFISNDVQSERQRTNRRMLSVFLWCFLAPAVLTALVLVLVRAGALPKKARGDVDWLMLIFPVLYSIYILGSEVLTGIPSVFRKGGLASSLNQARSEGEWRERVCASIRAKFSWDLAEFEWVLSSFRADLENMHYRAKYLTALAGAVFFLVMQGIDSIGDTQEVVVNAAYLWAEATNGISQLMALALFLVLLYLSGNQNYHSLRRYQSCAELILLEKKNQLDA